MFIPEEKISEILSISDILEVISEFVSLKKTGNNYVGLCPFHSEKTPSFSVSPQKQIFYCFGCGAGGNVFAFLMKHYGVSFPEAVNILAKRYGIFIDHKEINIEDKQKIELKEALFRINNKVKDYYLDMLKNSPSASSARAYLEKRLITQEIINEFGIGYASDSWDSIVSLFRKMKLYRSVAEQSGLVLKKRNNDGYYDRFRNRIIFPIFDINMQVAGFGGRVMDNSMPKYLNSPETLLYSKGKILYGFHASKRYCRETGKVYIVEGYFDFLSLYQNGIKNCAATLGTALTPYHVRLLKGYSSKIFLLFDSDNAGINAAKRGVDLFIKEGVELRIIILPKGDDPDSFVTKYGAKEFEDFASRAISAIEFLTEMAIKKHGLSIEGKFAILEEIKFYLAAIEDNALRSLYVKETAYRLGVDEETILEKVKKALVNSLPLQLSKVSFANSIISTHLLPPPLKENFIPREKQIISMMLQFPQIIYQVRESNVLEFLYSQKLKDIGNLILRVANSLCGNSSIFVGDVIEAAKNESDRELITSLAMMEFSDVNENEEEDNINSILERSILLIKRIINVRKREESKLTHEIRTVELCLNKEESLKREIEQNSKQKNYSDMNLTLELLRQRQIEIRQLRGYE